MIAALRRRPVAGTGVVLATVWLAVVVFEVTTSRIYDREDWYGILVTVADMSLRGVLGAAALVWLVEHGSA